MEIILYEDKYLEEVRDLLVELEDYIVSIDEDDLDRVGPNYREKMALYDLEEVKNNDGKCFLALEDNKVVGLIMGYIRKYDEEDYLDYKCPKYGVVKELIVSSKIRNKGVGTLLLEKMEDYFKSVDCEYIGLEVFAYNKNALNFYTKNGYHSRTVNVIKKVE